jgi:hypothetical protein
VEAEKAGILTLDKADALHRHKRWRLRGGMNPSVVELLFLHISFAVLSKMSWFERSSKSLSFCLKADGEQFLVVDNILDRLRWISGTATPAAPGTCSA